MVKRWLILLSFLERTMAYNIALQQVGLDIVASATIRYQLRFGA